MTEQELVTVRPDVDIRADIQDRLDSYPPLAHDRHQIQVKVEAGKAILTGHVKARATRYYLLQNVPHVPDVQSINADGLVDDESIRLEAGHRVPAGIQVRTEYGAVILVGKLPEGVSEKALVQAVEQIPGVHKVVTAFS